MSLKEQLEEIKNSVNPPKEAAQIMKRTTLELIESGQAEKAPRPGQKAPSFELPNIYGDMVNSERMLEKGPLVVHFYRGGWWPFCKTELSALQDIVEDIRNRGASLVAISPQKPEFLMQVVRENHIRFNLLFDEDNTVAREYNLVWTLPKDLTEVYRELGLDLEKFNGNEKWELPMPARFVIDRAGIVRASHVSPDHTDRPEPATAIDILDGLERD